MSLHVEVMGRGEDLVLLHGWAMHGGIWRGVAERLAERFCVHLVDLPGHGFSASVEPFSLQAIAARVAAEFPHPVHLLGWSLGGAVAMRWALDQPYRVRKLVLVASSPCFQERDDWPVAMRRDVLTRFASDLRHDYQATLRRFVALQAIGGQASKDVIRELQDSLFDRGQPDEAVLGSGLAILRDEDLRHELRHLDQPTLLIYGERDALTPAAAGRWLSDTLPDSELHLVSQASHAPFISHAAAFAERVLAFLG